ncbi:hypothetical protein [Pseudolysinimonas sp.]
MPTATEVDSTAEAAARRFRLAQTRGQQLLDEVDEWHSKSPPKVSFDLAPDGMGWMAVVHGYDPAPPLDAWGLQLGEVANHYRSVLNTTLTRIWNAEGLPRSNRLQYPVCVTRAQWSRASRVLAPLPERLVRLIYAGQPFVMSRAHGALPRDDVLAVLAWTDNQQKHQVELTASTSPVMNNFVAHAEFEESARVVDVRDISHSIQKREDGKVVILADTRPHRVKTLSTADLWLTTEITFADESGAWTEVRALLWEFLQRSRSVVQELLVVWSDESFDVDRIGGSVDFVSGAAFGKAAVDSLHGSGRWSKDFFNSGRFGEHRASAALEVGLSGVVDGRLSAEDH